MNFSIAVSYHILMIPSCLIEVEETPILKGTANEVTHLALGARELPSKQQFTYKYTNTSLCIKRIR